MRKHAARQNLESLDGSIDLLAGSF